mgnify:CR=1 FL=1
MIKLLYKKKGCFVGSLSFLLHLRKMLTGLYCIKHFIDKFLIIINYDSSTIFNLRILMHRLGYRDLHLERVLTKFRSRYIRYMQKKQQFPHEMGVLLGYPPEDVEGFIIYEGKNSLCEGYWKVYAEPQKKLRLFAQYDKARERLLDLLYCGVGMEDIVGVALDAESRAISQDYLFAS